MIITLISIVLLALGVLGLYFGSKSYYDELFLISIVITIIFTATVIFETTVIIINHSGVPIQIEQNEIEYESLCKRMEIVDSEYEDVSKSDVIRDVAEWNKKVKSAQYWAYNPWTNWYYSKEVVNELKLIE